MSPTAIELNRVARLLDVERTFCFLPRDGITQCNSYAKVFCAALGLDLPPLVANEQHAWLADLSNGWWEVDAIEAARRADIGYPVLASWANPTGGHGHIAMVLPTSVDGKMHVSSAGARNHLSTPIENSFGLQIHPTFFTTDQ